MSDNRFDSKAKEWDKKRFRRELAAAVSAAIGALDLNKNMLTMDFGCGTGLVSLPLADKVGKIVAFDTSQGMIEEFHQKLKEKGTTNIEPRCTDILTTDLAESFDLIFTSMTLHHIGDIHAVLKRFSELVKPGGQLAIADLDDEDGSFHKPGSEEKHHGFQRSTLGQKLEGLGFADISFATVHTISKTMDNGEVKNFSVFLLTAVKS